jgi:hypothetical protein
MRANIRKVIDAFLNSKNAYGDSKRTCRSDYPLGIYSYGLRILSISRPTTDGKTPDLGYELSGEGGYWILRRDDPRAWSKTTRSHIDACNLHFHVGDRLTKLSIAAQLGEEAFQEAAAEE